MVALVEDDDSYRVAVQRLLKSAGFSVQSFATAEDISQRDPHYYELPYTNM